MIADPETEAAFAKIADGPAPWETTGPRMVSTRADQITPSRPVWMWDRWLATGALHLLVGRQGGGKSTFAAWLSAQVTTGRPYPDDQSYREPENVATLSLEEADDRLVARLHAAGADVTRVEVLSDVEDVDDEGRPYRRPWRLPKDCSVLESFIRGTRIRLLVVDGLGYSITGDSHNYAVIGSALSALSGVAERTGCAILGLTHPPKGASDPVTAAIGSTAWTAIPRVVWVLGLDPQDESEQCRVARVSKTNYRPPDNGLGFTIGNDEEYECGYVTGLGMSAVSAEELVAARTTDGDRTERDEARDLLKSILEAGPVDTAEVLKVTRSSGMSDRTVTRARGDLRVRSSARHDPNTGRLIAWQLALPDQSASHSTNDATPVRQPLIGAVGALVPTREYELPQRPERQPGESGTVDAPPPPDDALFLDDENGPI
jgi:putative DNA primase/helicase